MKYEIGARWIRINKADRSKDIGMIIEVDKDSDTELQGKIIFIPEGCDYNYTIGESVGWQREAFALLSCIDHKWIEILDCQFPFKCCKVCKEIETLEQAG